MEDTDVSVHRPFTAAELLDWPGTFVDHTDLGQCGVESVRQYYDRTEVWLQCGTRQYALTPGDFLAKCTQDGFKCGVPTVWNY
jgi:hypothetical protein